jgi:hypothetical protein
MTQCSKQALKEDLGFALLVGAEVFVPVMHELR